VIGKYDVVVITVFNRKLNKSSKKKSLFSAFMYFPSSSINLTCGSVWKKSEK